MKIRILGAHNIESDKTGCTSFIIDDILAVDAGALTSSLNFAEQQKLKAVLLTHQHYDHLRDIPALAMNFFLHRNTIEMYSTRPVFETISAHLLNDTLYPNYLEKPPEKPVIRFNVFEPGISRTIAGYGVLPVPVTHAVPTVGYQITSSEGKKVFITSDTGPGLAACWKQVSPDLLIIEVTMLNKYNDSALQTGHLTPDLLQQELISFKEIKSYLPQVVTVHMNPLDEKGIKAEIDAVSKALTTRIRLGYEGMRLDL